MSVTGPDLFRSSLSEMEQIILLKTTIKPFNLLILMWHGIRSLSVMPDYSNYSVNDFVLDESFQQWVLNPMNERDLFWKEWLNKHPQKRKIINEARYIIENFKFSNYGLSEKNIKELWNCIRSQRRP